MIDNFGSIFYLIIYIINLVGLAYYTYLTYLNPKQIINDYELGDDSIALVRIVGSFVPTSSILRLTISIDCFKAELFIVNRPYFENKTFTLLFSKISKSNSNEL